MKQQPLNPFENLGEQLVNISKAHAFDIVSEQVKDLLKENEQLKEYANYIGDKIAAGDDEILTFQQWLDNPALSQTETK